jgi:hypothetical protein
MTYFVCFFALWFIAYHIHEFFTEVADHFNFSREKLNSHSHHTHILSRTKEKDQDKIYNWIAERRCQGNWQKIDNINGAFVCQGHLCVQGHLFARVRFQLQINRCIIKLYFNHISSDCIVWIVLAISAENKTAIEVEHVCHRLYF